MLLKIKKSNKQSQFFTNPDPEYIKSLYGIFIENMVETMNYYELGFLTASQVWDDDEDPPPNLVVFQDGEGGKKVANFRVVKYWGKEASYLVRCISHENNVIKVKGYKNCIALFIDLEDNMVKEGEFGEESAIVIQHIWYHLKKANRFK